MRYGAMYAIGMAYCGTSNNNAIRRLLHVAVSDVSDDVRMAAVTCLGFVLFRTPEQVLYFAHNFCAQRFCLIFVRFCSLASMCEGNSSRA